MSQERTAAKSMSTTETPNGATVADILRKLTSRFEAIDAMTQEAHKLCVMLKKAVMEDPGAIEKALKDMDGEDYSAQMAAIHRALDEANSARSQGKLTITEFSDLAQKLSEKEKTITQQYASKAVVLKAQINQMLQHTSRFTGGKRHAAEEEEEEVPLENRIPHGGTVLRQNTRKRAAAEESPERKILTAKRPKKS